MNEFDPIKCARPLSSRISVPDDDRSSLPRIKGFAAVVPAGDRDILRHRDTTNHCYTSCGRDCTKRTLRRPNDHSCTVMLDQSL